MTTFIDFVPNNATPFQFRPTLDGQVYNATVTWSLFGRRFYLNVVDLSGVPVISTALVGSPNGAAIEALSWANGTVTATTAEDHGYAIANTIMLTISGALPDAYNGLVPALITGKRTFTYPEQAFIDVPTAFGVANYNINLVGGLFASMLVYRQPRQQFEVSP